MRACVRMRVSMLTDACRGQRCQIPVASVSSCDPAIVVLRNLIVSLLDQYVLLTDELFSSRFVSQRLRAG